MKITTSEEAEPLPKNFRKPFTYAGGKSRVAAEIWARFGPVKHYVEPFAGGLGCLLRRPHVEGWETINDKCAFVTNFWRAVQARPE